MTTDEFGFKVLKSEDEIDKQLTPIWDVVEEAKSVVVGGGTVLVMGVLTALGAVGLLFLDKFLGAVL